MAKLTGKALVAQSGGPTAVINQSLVGVVQQANRYPEITHVYGSAHGVSGIVKEDLFDLTQNTSYDLELIAQTPASALGSSRDKPDAEYCEKIIKVFRAHEIRYFYYIGGNDSSDTCRLVAEGAKAQNYELRAVHVPKTIDNDLVITDHCPGFGSAGRFVAQAFAGVNQDNRALPGVYVGIVMGRHAGFLTAAAALGRIYEDDGPHLILTPERPLSIDQIVDEVQKAFDKYGRCVMAVSEGMTDETGASIIEKLSEDIEKDAHGNVQLSGSGKLGDLLADTIKAKTSIKRVRADTLGYLQRSFLGCVSPTDAREAREVGEKAVQCSIWKDESGSVSIKRIGNYAVDYDFIRLEDVAAKTKTMVDEYFASPTMISDEFIKYAAPLIGELPVIGRVTAPVVEKKLT